MRCGHSACNALPASTRRPPVVTCRYLSLPVVTRRHRRYTPSMYCPNCGTQYAFFEKTCTRCNVDLVEGDAPEARPAMFSAAMERDAAREIDVQPETSLVSVFKTSDPGLLPLATMALEGEGIEYFVKNSGKSDSLEWMMSQNPTTRPIVVEIMVGSDVAAKARDLLVDLENPMPVA